MLESRAAILLFLLCSTLPAGAQAPDAAAILKQSMIRYDKAKTFQGLVQITSKKQNGASASISMDVKAQNDGKGAIARSIIRTDADITAPNGRRRQQQTVIDDGKTIYLVDPANKRYVVQAHQSDRLSKLFERALHNLVQMGGGLKASVRNVLGRPTYALTGVNGAANILVLVDKQTLELKSLDMTRGQETSRLIVTKQLFDRPIAPATFTWSPPAGYQQTRPVAPIR